MFDTRRSVSMVVRCGELSLGSEGVKQRSCEIARGGARLERGPDRVHAARERALVAVVVDDEIRVRALELGGHLCGDQMDRIILREAAARGETLQPNGLG